MEPPPSLVQRPTAHLPATVETNQTKDSILSPRSLRDSKLDKSAFYAAIHEKYNMNNSSLYMMKPEAPGCAEGGEIMKDFRHAYRKMVD